MGEYRSKSFGGAAMLGLLLATAPAQAAVSVFTTEAGWLAAVSGITTEDFEASPLGNLPVGTTDIGAFDITIDANQANGTRIRDAGLVNGSRELEPFIIQGGTTVMKFSGFGASIFGFAGTWDSTITRDLLTVTIDGTTIEFDNHLSGAGRGFLGFVSTNAFSSLSFGVEGLTAGGESFSLDDAMFATQLASTAVPEPAALGLLGTGLLGLVLARRRRA